MKILIGAEEGTGNAIEKTPFLRQIKEECNDSIIDVLSSVRSYDVFKDNPNIRNLYLINKDEIKEHYDIGFNSCFRTGSFDWIKNHCDKFICDTNPAYHMKSELQCNLDILKQNQIIYSNKFYPNEFVFDKYKKKSNRILFHTGCMNLGQWHNRMWPNMYWIDLINYCKKLSGYELNLIVGPQEENDEIIKETGIQIVYGTLKEIASLMYASSLLITIDSGIMHLGTTTGIKQISLWGPTSEIKSEPHVEDDRMLILRKELNCQRCYIGNKEMFIRCRDNVCMKMLSPGFVFKQVERMLAC